MDFKKMLRSDKDPTMRQLTAKEKLHSTFQQDHDRDREDLFPTKVLEIKPSGWFGKNIAIFSRDPGSARALIPVIQQLQKDRVAITAVVDGRAQEDI